MQTPHINSWTRTISFGLLCLLLARASYADAPLEGVKPAQWRVIWTSDPATTATISWSTAQPGSSHVVEFRKRGDDSTQGVRAAESGRVTGGPHEFYYHHARLTDLQPATAYEVRMVSDNERSPLFYFVTAPAEDRPFSLMHGGDSRSDRKERRRMNEFMENLVARSLKNDDPADDILALAHGGDFIANGTNSEQWSEWLSDHELTTAADGRLLPIIPARGNHDIGPAFNQIFGFPEDDLNYYAINITPQVRFITLNSETSTAGDQALWLERELAQSRLTSRWIVPQYHRPAFPAVKLPGGALLTWVPLFEKYNVDLVCESDGHNIKRTVPIRNNKPDETGVVYIGEGGLGVSQRTPKPDRWFLQEPGMADKGSHVFVLTFTKDKLIGQCVLPTGDVRDRFTRNVR